MQINKREDIEAAFKEVLNNNPLARNAMMLYRNGDLSEREALMYAVVALAAQNKELEQLAIEGLHLRPPAMRLEDVFKDGPAGR